ncbi:hypothetical protein SAM19_04961 [Brevibacillus laterosporus]|nr:hypothetical protein [Brevibacillus laterosporus]
MCGNHGGAMYLKSDYNENEFSGLESTKEKGIVPTVLLSHQENPFNLISWVSPVFVKEKQLSFDKERFSQWSVEGKTVVFTLVDGQLRYDCASRYDPRYGQRSPSRAEGNAD